MASLHLAADPAANTFLAEDPAALLIGMLLDQQIPLERAFSAPYELAQRLSVKKLSMAQLSQTDPETLQEIFSQRPALHRFPGAMAARVHKLATMIVDDYDGEPSAVWRSADTGNELLKRVEKLPGFGAQKAKIFVALLGKQFGVQPAGWQEAAGEFGEEGSHLSVADIVDDATLIKVRDYKKTMKQQHKQAAAKS